MTEHKRYRSAETGEFVTEETAQADPGRHVSETVKIDHVSVQGFLGALAGAAAMDVIKERIRQITVEDHQEGESP